MSAMALIVMVTICGVVWGGFAAMLVWMIAVEKRGSAAQAAGEPEK